MGLDYSQYNKLFMQNEQLLTRMQGFVEKVLYEAALEVLNKTIFRTPVDTGLLRGSWELSEIYWYGDTALIILINNTYYASFVEYGHRTKSGGFVPGRFMAKLSIEEVMPNFERMYDSLFLQEFSDIL